MYASRSERLDARTDSSPIPTTIGMVTPAGPVPGGRVPRWHGQRVTLRLEQHLAHVIADRRLWRTLPRRPAHPHSNPEARVTTTTSPMRWATREGRTWRAPTTERRQPASAPRRSTARRRQRAAPGELAKGMGQGLRAAAVTQPVSCEPCSSSEASPNPNPPRICAGRPGAIPGARPSIRTQTPPIDAGRIRAQVRACWTTLDGLAGLIKIYGELSASASGVLPVLWTHRRRVRMCPPSQEVGSSDRPYLRCGYGR